MLCRTENRVGQLAQAESGKQTTEARALDAKLGRRPSDRWVVQSAVLRLGERGDVRDRSLSHAKPFCKVWHYPAALPVVISIMTPRIHGQRPGSARVEIWISKRLSYTMLPTHARARSRPAVKELVVARGPQGGCAVPPQPSTWHASIQTVASLLRSWSSPPPDDNSQVLGAHDFAHFSIPRTTPAVELGTDHPAAPTPRPSLWRIEIGPPTRPSY